MKKIFFAIFASILLVSCQTGNTNQKDTDDTTPIVQPADPIVTLVTINTGVTDVVQPVTENPEQPAIKYLAKIPNFVVRSGVPSHSTRNVTVTMTNEELFTTGIAPALIASWGGSQEVSDGSTFDKMVYDKTVHFTVSISEDGSVVYSGLFSDGEGTMKIVYYPETETFDIDYRVIYVVNNTGSERQFSFMGEMKRAKIVGSTYTGDFQAWAYYNVEPLKYPGQINHEISSYKYHVNATEDSVSATSYAVCIRNTFMYNDTNFLPNEDQSYSADYWDSMVAMNSLPENKDDNDWSGWYIQTSTKTFIFSIEKPAVIDPVTPEQPADGEPVSE